MFATSKLKDEFHQVGQMMQNKNKFSNKRVFHNNSYYLMFVVYLDYLSLFRHYNILMSYLFKF